ARLSRRYRDVASDQTGNAEAGRSVTRKHAKEGGPALHRPSSVHQEVAGASPARGTCSEEPGDLLSGNPAFLKPPRRRCWSAGRRNGRTRRWSCTVSPGI